MFDEGKLRAVVAPRKATAFEWPRIQQRSRLIDAIDPCWCSAGCRNRIDSDFRRRDSQECDLVDAGNGAPRLHDDLYTVCERVVANRPGRAALRDAVGPHRDIDRLNRTWSPRKARIPCRCRCWCLDERDTRPIRRPRWKPGLMCGVVRGCVNSRAVRAIGIRHRDCPDRAARRHECPRRMGISLATCC